MRMILAVKVPAKESCTKTPQGGSTNMGDYKTSSVKLGITKIATEQTISCNMITPVTQFIYLKYNISV